MEKVNVTFFGSTSDSVIVLEALSAFASPTYKLEIVAVVTQPPRAIGRKQIITPTPVELWAKKHAYPVLSFASSSENQSLYESEATVIDTLQPFGADLLISASYGQKIPTKTIGEAKFGGLNVHPSLLPRWRGADPVPWAILSGDQQTGVSVITLSEAFDEGKIIAQKKLPITPKDTSEPLRKHLFEIGALLLIESLPQVLSGKDVGKSQAKSGTPYARRFSRDDGFEPWDMIQKAQEDSTEATRIERKFRAFTPWPGVWTKITVHNEEKRLKILACHIENDLLAIDTVQLEGKNEAPYSQFKNAYLPLSQTS
jgi:methionyl-tRNA formyltransferase